MKTNASSKSSSPSSSRLQARAINWFGENHMLIILKEVIGLLFGAKVELEKQNQNNAWNKAKLALNEIQVTTEQKERTEKRF